MSFFFLFFRFLARFFRNHRRKSLKFVIRNIVEEYPNSRGLIKFCGGNKRSYLATTISVSFLIHFIFNAGSIINVETILLPWKLESSSKQNFNRARMNLISDETRSKTGKEETLDILLR